MNDITLSLEFCYKDLWFGIYWDKTLDRFIDINKVTIRRYYNYDVYIGIPFLVIHYRLNSPTYAYLTIHGWIEK